MSTLKILLLGDVVGDPGKAMVAQHLPELRKTYHIDAVIINGENSSPRGKGITVETMKFFKSLGVNLVTSGNHIWDSRDIYSYLNEQKDLLRPENFPSDCPGKGVGFFEVAGCTVGVLNIQGRVFMRETLDCPFKTAESALQYIKTRTKIIIVDVHAEATSEKVGMGYYLDGHVSAVVGTHTHIPTSDERILPGGTAYVTDLGMAGALNSMLGMKKEPIIAKFLTQMPHKFEVETVGPFFMSGVLVEIDTKTGKALKIERVVRNSP